MSKTTISFVETKKRVVMIKTCIRWILFVVLSSWLIIAFIMVCGEPTGELRFIEFFCIKCMALAGLYGGVNAAAALHRKGLLPPFIDEITEED